MKLKTLLSIMTGLLILVTGLGLLADSAEFVVENLNIYPPSPKLLQPGDKVKVSFRYENNYDTKVKVHILPFSDGELTEEYKASKPKTCAPGKGRIKGFFTTDAERAQIDTLKIRITTVDDEPEILLEKDITVKYTFRENLPF